MAENVDKIGKLIHDDGHQTIQKLAYTAAISYGVCQETIKENLNMRRVAVKFVPGLVDK
jgi:hypothetical protein